MIATPRRINLLQAWKMRGGRYLAFSDFVAGGAYGSRRSIHEALLLLEAHGVVVTIKNSKARGQLYCFTRAGVCAMGFIPSIGEHPDEETCNPADPRPVR